MSGLDGMSDVVARALSSAAEDLMSDIDSIRDDENEYSKVDAKPYTEDRFGRVHHSVSRSIRVWRGNGGVHIHDGWWRKNPDIWTGWVVVLEDDKGYTRARFGPSKNRADVVASVVRMIGAQSAQSA